MNTPFPSQGPSLQAIADYNQNINEEFESRQSTTQQEPNYDTLEPSLMLSIHVYRPGSPL